MQRGPLKLFFSYAHEDADARSELDDHLELLERQARAQGRRDLERPPDHAGPGVGGLD